MPGGQLTSVLTHLRRMIAGGDVPPRSDAELLGRFLDRKDEDAFAQLVHRHGPLVWNLCLRILHHTQDAEDAFQATFLVLARKARSIRKQPSLASWLYGVAYRTATRLRQRRDQHRERAMQLATNPTPNPLPAAGRGQGERCPDWQELRPIVDEEVNQLPEKYRSPVLLCYFQGKTHDEAARELGWPKGTVAGRLARARDLLRGRLLRRGLAFSGAGLATLITTSAATASVPEMFLTTIPSAALAFAAGSSAAATGAAAIAEGVMHAMFITKLRIAAAICVGAILLALGGGTIAYKALAGDDALVPGSGGNGLTLGNGDGGKKAGAEPKTDEERLLGTWVRVSGGDDPELKDKPVRSFDKIVFSKDLFQFCFDELKHDYAWKINAAKSPKELDIIEIEPTPGKAKQKPTPCIYKLDGDTLEIAMGDPGFRPNDFAKAGKFGRHFVLKREKATEKPKSDQELILGTWVRESGGGQVPNVDKLTLSKERLIWHFGQLGYVYTWKIDSARTPKEIDLLLKGQPHQLGIYKLDGDTLEIVWGAAGQRPKDFAKDDDHLVFKREKPGAEKPKTDQELLLGTWTVASRGDKQNFDKLTFTAEKIIYHYGDDTAFQSVYKLDPTTDPKSMDIESATSDPPRTGLRTVEPYRCIYKLDGDTLELAIGLPTERPKDFAAAAKAGQLVVLKREKAAEKPKTDEELIQGEWKWERHSEATGKVQDEQTYVFKGDRFWVVLHGGGEIGPFTFRLDASKSPKEIEVTGSLVLKGIYELDGSTLRLGFHVTPESLPPYGVGRPSAQELERPKDLTAAKAVRVFQRDGKPAATLLPLKNVDASKVAEFLQTIYPQAGGPPTFVADPRTNSILIQATPKQLEEIKQLLEKIDTLGAKPDAAKPANPFVKEIIDPKLTLDLVVGQTRVLVLKQEPSRIQIATETFAKFNLITNTQVSLLGVAAGTTTLNLWFKGADGKEELLSYLVNVVDKDAKPGDAKAGGPLTPRARDIVKEMIETARTEQDLRKREYEAGQKSGEEVCAASRRLAQAYGYNPEARKDFLDALQAHVERMKEAEKIANTRFETGKITGQDLATIKYHRLEAELWLEMEKAKPKGQLDGRIEIQRMRVEQAEAALATRQERLAWSERLATKGFVGQSEVAVANAEVKAAEIALAEAKLALDALLAEPKEPAQPERKPGKE